MTVAAPPTFVPETGPAVWLGSRLDLRTQGTHRLRPEQIAEIDAALERLRALGERDFPEITPETFPLPVLGRALARLQDVLRRGRGFLLMRGLPVERYSPDDLARIHYGLGVHVGCAIPQSHHGELLGHVMNVSDVEPGARGYHTGRALGFHTDNCDIVSLMCLRTGEGGRSRIASAAALHNGILHHRPELLARLYEGITCRRQALDAEHGSGIAVRQVATFSRASGELSCYLNFGYVRSALKVDPLAVTAAQGEALEILRRGLRTPGLALEMDFVPGDIQFLNNRRILHSRSAYAEPSDVDARRHLLRLWLTIPSWPPLPANQGMHDASDHSAWRLRRTPLMELPSRYVADVRRRKAA